MGGGGGECVYMYFKKQIFDLISELNPTQLIKHSSGTDRPVAASTASHLAVHPQAHLPMWDELAVLKELQRAPPCAARPSSVPYCFRHPLLGRETSSRLHVFTGLQVKRLGSSPKCPRCDPPPRPAKPPLVCSILAE